MGVQRIFVHDIFAFVQYYVVVGLLHHILGIVITPGLVQVGHTCFFSLSSRGSSLIVQIVTQRLVPLLLKRIVHSCCSS